MVMMSLDSNRTVTKIVDILLDLVVASIPSLVDATSEALFAHQPKVFPRLSTKYYSTSLQHDKFWNSKGLKHSPNTGNTRYPHQGTPTTNSRCLSPATQTAKVTKTICLL